MDDIDKRILAFALSVPNEADRKRAVFERLKTESPDVAEWISQMSQAFGRPAAIVIKFRSGELFRSGRIMAAQDYPDFAKRCERNA